jgi:hypothetical protein
VVSGEWRVESGEWQVANGEGGVDIYVVESVESVERVSV